MGGCGCVSDDEEAGQTQADCWEALLGAGSEEQQPQQQEQASSPSAAAASPVPPPAAKGGKAPAEVVDCWEALLDDVDEEQQPQLQQEQEERASSPPSPSSPSPSPSQEPSSPASSSELLWGLTQGATDQLALLGGAQLLGLRRIRQLGSGGEAEVFEVRAVVELPDGSARWQHAALKVIRNIREEHFERQRATWATTQQKAGAHIMPLLASGWVESFNWRHDGWGLFLMPLATCTLEQVAHAAAPSERAQLAGLVGRALVRLLADLQAAGIRYGDFKLSNVLVMPSGALVLADFGLTVQLPSSCQQQGGGATKAPKLLTVTPCMTPPEVARGAKRAGCEYDVWGVGMVLLEVLLGKEALGKASTGCFDYCKAMYALCRLVDVAGLHAACSSSPEWQQQPGAAELGGVLFGCMVTEQAQRSSGAQLLQLPCFSEAPAPAELARLHCCANVGVAY